MYERRLRKHYLKLQPHEITIRDFLQIGHCVNSFATILEFTCHKMRGSLGRKFEFSSSSGNVLKNNFKFGHFELQSRMAKKYTRNSKRTERNKCLCVRCFCFSTPALLN